MRKIIVLNIFLIIVLAVSITFACLEFQAFSNWIGLKNELTAEYENGIYTYQQYSEILNSYSSQALKYGLYGAFSLIGCVLCVGLLLMVDKGKFTKLKGILSGKLHNFNQIRTERKAAKSAEQKKARIAELEQELEQLKNDE